MTPEDRVFEESNSRLWRLLPRDQKDRVFSKEYVSADIGKEFLGFVNIYERLAQIIPRHWTVVDLGCAYAPQAFFFTAHKSYIGVDLEEIDRRFSASNTCHREMTISQFIKTEAQKLRLETTFAICSYVPPWHDNNIELARLAFKNIFAFYPAGEESAPPAIRALATKEDGNG